MNEAESVVAKQLIQQLRLQGYLLGDSAYDSNQRHALCAGGGLRLLAPRKRPGTGLTLPAWVRGPRRVANSVAAKLAVMLADVARQPGA